MNNNVDSLSRKLINLIYDWGPNTASAHDESFEEFRLEDIGHLISADNDDKKSVILSVYNAYYKFFARIANGAEGHGVYKLHELVGPMVGASNSVRDGIESESKPHMGYYSPISVRESVSGLNMYKVLTNLEGVDSPLWKMYSAFMEALGTPVDVEDTKIYKAAETLGKIYFTTCLNDTRAGKLKVSSKISKILSDTAEKFSKEFQDERYLKVFEIRFLANGEEKLESDKAKKMASDWSSACSKSDRYALCDIEAAAKEELSGSRWFEFLCKIHSDYNLLMFPRRDVGETVYKAVTMCSFYDWNRDVVYRILTEHTEDFLKMDHYKTPSDSSLINMSVMSKVGVSVEEAKFFVH